MKVKISVRKPHSFQESIFMLLKHIANATLEASQTLPTFDHRQMSLQIQRLSCELISADANKTRKAVANPFFRRAISATYNLLDTWDPLYPTPKRYRTLLQEIESLPATQCAERFKKLESAEPEIHDLLNVHAQELLHCLWEDMAAGLDHTLPILDHAIVWTRANHHSKARNVLEMEPEWKHLPDYRKAHAAVSARTGETDAALQDVAWLCWYHPQAADNALSTKKFPDTQINELWIQFGETNLKTEYFPAWLLIHAPVFARGIPPTLYPANSIGETHRILRNLINQSIYSDDSITLRKELKSASPELFEYWKSWISKLRK